MRIKFHKYQGTGNDFVMIDNLSGNYDNLSMQQIVSTCDRRFGVGADGLIKINRHSEADFEVDYYNSDGSKSFCGNGARCSVAFVESLGINVSSTFFQAIDGLHHARKDSDGLIHLEMMSVNQLLRSDEDYVLNTGSPHFCRFVKDLNQESIIDVGKAIRYSEVYKKEGINVNLIQIENDHAISIATYERGVENETLSCGTGATACAITFAEQKQYIGNQVVEVKVKGGELKVSFAIDNQRRYSDIRLIGPAEFVFEGEINV